MLKQLSQAGKEPSNIDFSGISASLYNIEYIGRKIMKVAIFLNMLLNAINRILGIAGFVLCCSIPAHAGNPKAFDKSDSSSYLILTLPDQWLAEEKANQPVNWNAATRNNETQASALKGTPVNVDCDMDVIENTAADVPLSNRLFGECDLHYHY